MIKILILVLLGVLVDSAKIKSGIPTIVKHRNNVPNKDRIVGGVVVTPGEFPHVISMHWYGDHICGGTILNENVIMSAAHCSDGWESDYDIVAGEWSLTGNDTTEQTRKVSRIEMHEDYDDYTFEADIALMWLDRPLIFNDHVQPVLIPQQGMDSTGDAVVTGWGYEREGEHKLSDKLQKVTLNLISDEECKSKVPNGETDVLPQMICAYVPDGGKDSCQGDSGGALEATLNDRTYQAGVVSWGYGCARPNMPGMYTEVSYYTDWIKSFTTINEF